MLPAAKRMNAMKTAIQSLKPGLALLAATGLLLGAAAVKPAAAAGYSVGQTAHVVGVAHWDVLNMRKWPASYSQKVGHAMPHAQVWVHRCVVKPGASDWCKISWMHQDGWVNSRYLSLD